VSTSAFFQAATFLAAMLCPKGQKKQAAWGHWLSPARNLCWVLHLQFTSSLAMGPIPTRFYKGLFAKSRVSEELKPLVRAIKCNF